MGQWSKVGAKVWFVASFMGFIMLSACGKDNGQQSVTANTPQNSTDCMSNYGYGCSWSYMPTYWQPYPRDNNGYYAGYQNNNQSCGYGTYPVYRPGWGLACMPIQNPQMYYQQPWGNNGSSYLMYCNALYQNQCPNGGYCVPIYQTNPQYGYQWNTPNYATWGICR